MELYKDSRGNQGKPGNEKIQEIRKPSDQKFSKTKIMEILDLGNFKSLRNQETRKTGIKKQETQKLGNQTTEELK